MDSFVFTVSDGIHELNKQSFTITLTAVDDDAAATTQSMLPALTNLVLVEGGTRANNSLEREIDPIGKNFVASAGNNILRLENRSAVFETRNTSATATSLNALVPEGAPVGTYDVRIINKTVWPQDYKRPIPSRKPP